MLLLVNVDDVSGEMIPYVIEELMALGAANVHVVQSMTKKGRPERLFFIDTPEEHIDVLAGFLVAELGTLGMRILETRHIRFEYRISRIQLTVSVDQRDIHVIVRAKQVFNSQGRVAYVKSEYEDLRSAVTKFQELGLQVTLTALKRLVEQCTLGQGEVELGNLRARCLKEDDQFPE